MWRGVNIDIVAYFPSGCEDLLNREPLHVRLGFVTWWVMYESHDWAVTLRGEVYVESYEKPCADGASPVALYCAALAIHDLHEQLPVHPTL